MARYPMVWAAALLVLSPGLAPGQWGIPQTGDRGLVAVPDAEGSIFISWRLLNTDPADITFDLLRIDSDQEPQQLNAEPIATATCWRDTEVAAGTRPKYFVRPRTARQALPDSDPVQAWDKPYWELPLQTIEGYSPGDAAVADLDGDGQYEFVLHQTSRPRDNSHSGITGRPILDAYKMDGTLLWRIDLGINIREGEHYTQLVVYDLDGDGAAELLCKTADGAMDGTGVVIGDPDRDWRQLDPEHRSFGRVLEGPEFLTLFDGRTGKALSTVDYIPSRDPIDGWGGIGGNGGNDSYGNRCDRFLACVAYLDGENPSAVMCRGVYGRTVLAAWDVQHGQLASRWVFDSGISYPPYRDASPFSGMGGHSLAVADVDDDGRDEIVYQAMVVDDDGTGLYSTGLRHGDAMHVTDIDPERPGLEVFTIQENEDATVRFQTPGAALRDARTGEILWSHSPGVDVGSGLAADIDPTSPGCELWGGPGGLRSVSGRALGPAPRSSRFAVWWDGDLLRELLSGTRITKWNWQTQREEPFATLQGRSAARGPNLLGDFIGDWREEVLIIAPDRKSLRLYTSPIPTDHRLVTLMQDRQYRLSIVWQNVVYNKPPHPSFFLGAGMALPQR